VVSLPSYFVGLDLGKRQDFTALAVIEEPLWVADRNAAQRAFASPGYHTTAEIDALPRGWQAPDTLSVEARIALRRENWRHGRPAQPPLAVRHLERFPLGTSYPTIVQRVAALLASPPLRGDAVLIVDGTGVGAAVVDDFRLALRSLIDVAITGGQNVTREPPDRYRVPKRDLVSALQSLLQADRLKIARGLPEAPTLVNELLNFQVSITEAANDRYEGRSGVHDDLVLAVAMGCWYRTWYSTLLDHAHARKSGG